MKDLVQQHRNEREILEKRVAEITEGDQQKQQKIEELEKRIGMLCHSCNGFHSLKLYFVSLFLKIATINTSWT